MDMERINSDTIRVFMHMDELKQRGIEIGDLIQDHQRIEKFFYGVLDEVDQDHSFLGESDGNAVTFQVMPSGEGLEIFISRSISPDVPKEDIEESMNDDDNLNEDEDQLSQVARNTIKKFLDTPKDSAADDKDKLVEFDEAVNHADVVFKMFDFDTLVLFARDFKMPVGTSSLYRLDGDYYLALRFYTSEMHEAEANGIAKMVLDFGTRCQFDISYLAEHARLIEHDTALETLRYYFKK